MLEIVCEVTGNVQGVFYRAYVEDVATKLGVRGVVCNEADDSVTVVAQADQDTLKDFIECLHEGSSRAEVAGVSVEWRRARTTYADFSVLH